MLCRNCSNKSLLSAVKAAKDPVPHPLPLSRMPASHSSLPRVLGGYASSFLRTITTLSTGTGRHSFHSHGAVYLMSISKYHSIILAPLQALTLLLEILGQADMLVTQYTISIQIT